MPSQFHTSSSKAICFLKHFKSEHWEDSCTVNSSSELIWFWWRESHCTFLNSLCAPVHNVDLKKQDQGKSTNHHTWRRTVSLQQTRNGGPTSFLYHAPWRLVHWVIIGHKLLRPYSQWFLICLLENPFIFSGNWERLPSLAPRVHSIQELSHMAEWQTSPQLSELASSFAFLFFFLCKLMLLLMPCQDPFIECIW